MRDNKYMDAEGTFYPSHLVYKGSEHLVGSITEATHIRIQAPDPYVSPVDHPEHYGREKY